MKKDYYSGLYDYIIDTITDYCIRHNYIIIEIDFKRKRVFYYEQGKNMFEDYSSFNYLKVDLTK